MTINIIARNKCILNVDVTGMQQLALNSVSGLLYYNIIDTHDYVEVLLFQNGQGVKHKLAINQEFSAYPGLSSDSISEILNQALINVTHNNNDRFASYDPYTGKWTFNYTITACTYKLRYMLGITQIPKNQHDISDTVAVFSGTPYFFVMCDKLNSPMRYNWQYSNNANTYAANKNIVSITQNAFSITGPFALQGGQFMIDGGLLKNATFSIVGMWGEDVELSFDALWSFSLMPAEVPTMHDTFLQQLAMKQQELQGGGPGPGTGPGPGPDDDNDNPNDITPSENPDDSVPPSDSKPPPKPDYYVVTKRGWMKHSQLRAPKPVNFIIKGGSKGVPLKWLQVMNTQKQIGNKVQDAIDKVQDTIDKVNDINVKVDKGIKYGNRLKQDFSKDFRNLNDQVKNLGDKINDMEDIAEHFMEDIVDDHHELKKKIETLSLLNTSQKQEESIEEKPSEEEDEKTEIEPQSIDFEESPVKQIQPIRSEERHKNKDKQIPSDKEINITSELRHQNEQKEKQLIQQVQPLQKPKTESRQSNQQASEIQKITPLLTKKEENTDSIDSNAYMTILEERREENKTNNSTDTNPVTTNDQNKTNDDPNKTSNNSNCRI